MLLSIRFIFSIWYFFISWPNALPSRPCFCNSLVSTSLAAFNADCKYFACGYESLKLIQMNVGVDIVNFIVTALLSAISAFLAIHLFMKFLDKVGMLPFVVYRIVLGIVLIFLFV